MTVINFLKKLFNIKAEVKVPAVEPKTHKKLKSVLNDISIELLDEEVICKLDFFSGKCWYVKKNPPVGMRPFRGQALKAFVLFNLPNVNTPDNIEDVTVLVDGTGEEYSIPNWTYDYMLELEYDNYPYEDMLCTVSNERVIEADFSLINKIKDAARRLYKNIIGEEYTNDDLYTSCGNVIRKYTVIVTDKTNNEILLFKTFDAREDAEYFYNNLLNI